MTGLDVYPGPKWQCPMCQDSYVVSEALLNSMGYQGASTIVDQYKDEHIDWHCDVFAQELELV